MTEPNTDQKTRTPEEDVAYWKAEAKKAFEARDAVKEQARALEGRTLSESELREFQELKKQQGELEERRKRAEGQFDVLQKEMSAKHQKEIDEREARIGSLSTKFQRLIVQNEFNAALEWFGGAAAKTILPPDIAFDALGKYVSVENVDNADGSGYRIAVKLPSGETVRGKDGNPAPFQEAIAKLIDALPHKEKLLRGSGRTGSGSSGGSRDVNRTTIDTSRLKPQDFADPKVREAVREEINRAGGLQVGSAFDRLRASRQ